MMVSMEHLLQEMVEKNASDLHLTANAPPQFRIDGALVATEYDVLTAETCKSLSCSILSDDQVKRFEAETGLDIAFGRENLGRFRLNAYWQRGAMGVAIRYIPWEVPSFEELGLPQTIKDFSERRTGVFICSGATGTGKSTTLAAMVDHINSSRRCHIMTIEDPIEYLHEHKQAIINQREIGKDAASFASAVRQVLRQDPDVISIGEMRDLETVRTALMLAETGHLVLTTLHTSDAAQVVTRIVDIFPPYEQGSVRTQLSLVLNGVMVQQLVPDAAGKGRVLATEVLVATMGVRNLIRENQPQQIRSMIETGSKEGMHTLNESLLRLHYSGRITLEDALRASSDPKDLMRMMERDPNQYFRKTA
jgi:twitching motility protein PilT